MRRPHEDIDSLLSRFEELRYKAAREEHCTMSFEGWPLRILQQCSLSQAQILHVLEPFAYQMPRTDEQFNQLIDRLRRVGHQTENRAGAVMRLIQGQRPSDTAYPYHLVQDEDFEAPMDAPPAFMMQPALPGPAPSVSSWPVAAPSWDATAYAPATSSDAPMFW